MVLSRKKNPNSNPRAGGIGFAITALALSSIFGFSLGGIILGTVIGLGIGKVVSIMGSGLDTPTHNKEDVERQRQAAAEEERRKAAEQERLRREAASRIPLTGDPTADDVIVKGQEMIAQIKRENAAIPDQTLSAQMDTLSAKCEMIFRTVSDTPAKAPQVRKFMNYYLPTTLKILANYRTMQQRGVSVQDMNAARETTVRGMNMILTACQKQIDNLHKENMLDINTDIDVLEQMLKRDGYTESELTGIRDIMPAEPRTAAEAQMRTSSTPIMDFPAEDNRYGTDPGGTFRQYGDLN